MKDRWCFRRLSLLILLIFGFLLFFSLTDSVLAQEFCGLPMSYCNNKLGSPPPDLCCRLSGGCSGTKCGDITQWSWCRTTDCCGTIEEICKNFAPPPFHLEFCWKELRFEHKNTACAATDSCDGSGPRLKAGLCSDSGCEKGGYYKVCCEEVDGKLTGNLGGTCWYGNFTGICPPGTRTVIGSTCPVETEPTPPPTSVPTQPPPTPGGCPSTTSCPSGYAHNGWCTPSSNCQAQGGIPIYKGWCSEPNDCLCCTPIQPEGKKIWVNVVGTNPKVCDQVTVEVYQEPNNYDSSDCYYDYINVKLDNPGGTVLPPNLVGCRAEDFKDRNASNSCDWEPSGSSGNGRCRTCIWDTSNTHSVPEPDFEKEPDEYAAYEAVINGSLRPFPSGYYVASVYYGGHGDPGCNDGQDDAADDTTLMRDLVNEEGEEVCDYDPFDPSEPCPVGTTKTPVDIFSQVDVYFNSLRGWTTVSGNPAIFGWHEDCNYRSRGDNCDAWRDVCSGINAIDGSFLAGSYSGDVAQPYEVETIGTEIEIPENTVGDFYLVSILGTGVRSVKSGYSDTGRSRPYIKIASGGVDTGFYKISDEDCFWQEGTYKISAEEAKIKVSLKSKTTDYTSNMHPVQSAFDNLRLYHCARPKTCTISTPSTVKNQAEPFQASFSGGGLGSGDTTRLWLEKRDGGEVSGVTQGVDYLSKSCSGGNCYYELAGCTNDGSGSCSSSANLSTNWPAGEYYFHCDVPHNPGACSGNPLCTYTSSTFCNSCPGPKCGTYDCGSGWQPCSDNDKKCLSIISPPTCDVTLIPPFININQGETSLLEANPSIENGTANRIVFTSGNSGIATVNPSQDYSSPYRTTVAAQDVGETTVKADVYLDPGNILGCSETIPAIINPVAAWYQTQGGNVYGRAISSQVSEGVANRFFSLYGSWGKSGFVSAQTHLPGPANFNNAGISQTDASWQAQGDLSLVANRYNYQYFASLLDVNPANSEILFRTENNLTNPASLGKNIVVYSPSSGGTMSINNSWAIGNSKRIALVNGNLTINEPITIGPSGFLAVIVKGNLVIDVGTGASSTTPLVQGVYVVDGSITTVKRDAEPKFIGEGIFFSGNGFVLNKDLVGNNLSYPAEVFIFNPRYLFAAPKSLRSWSYFWQEVAP